MTGNDENETGVRERKPARDEDRATLYPDTHFQLSTDCEDGVSREGAGGQGEGRGSSLWKAEINSQIETLADKSQVFQTCQVEQVEKAKENGSKIAIIIVRAILTFNKKDNTNTQTQEKG